MQFILCCMPLNFKDMDITEKQRKEYRDKVIEAIEKALKENDCESGNPHKDSFDDCYLFGMTYPKPLIVL